MKTRITTDQYSELSESSKKKLDEWLSKQKKYIVTHSWPKPNKCKIEFSCPQCGAIVDMKDILEKTRQLSRQ